MFLSNDSIKLGDFGLSVQLKNLNKTLPNEIRQQVGTVRKWHDDTHITRACSFSVCLNHIHLPEIVFSL